MEIPVPLSEIPLYFEAFESVVVVASCNFMIYCMDLSREQERMDQIGSWSLCTCPDCGTAYGLTLVSRALQEWEKDFWRKRKWQLYDRIFVVFSITVTCPSCNQIAQLKPGNKT